MSVGSVKNCTVQPSFAGIRRSGPSGDEQREETCWGHGGKQQVGLAFANLRKCIPLADGRVEQEVTAGFTVSIMSERRDFIRAARLLLSKASCSERGNERIEVEKAFQEFVGLRNCKKSERHQHVRGSTTKEKRTLPWCRPHRSIEDLHPVLSAAYLL